jgi:hypothetical protein
MAARRSTYLRRKFLRVIDTSNLDFLGDPFF